MKVSVSKKPWWDEKMIKRIRILDVYVQKNPFLQWICLRVLVWLLSVNVKKGIKKSVFIPPTRALLWFVLYNGLREVKDGR